MPLEITAIKIEKISKIKPKSICQSQQNLLLKQLWRI